MSKKKRQPKRQPNHKDLISILKYIKQWKPTIGRDIKFGWYEGIKDKDK